MFSPLHSAGGVRVPHPIFMSFQGFSNALGCFPCIPSFRRIPFSRTVPNGFSPRFTDGMVGAHFIGEFSPQLRKLFIGGLSHETTDDQLRQYYSQWGTVVDCIVIRDPHTKYSRGFGFVTFATVSMAEAAMAARPHTINNKVVDPKRAIPREYMSPLPPNGSLPFLETEPDPGCKLSLSGIQWSWHTVDDLRQYFDAFGNVDQVEILGNPRGSGFVVFEDKAAADKCLKHGKIHLINGQKCEVTQYPIEHTVYQRTKMHICDAVDMEADDMVEIPGAGELSTSDDSLKSVQNYLENVHSLNRCTHVRGKTVTSETTLSSRSSPSDKRSNEKRTDSASEGYSDYEALEQIG